MAFVLPITVAAKFPEVLASKKVASCDIIVLKILILAFEINFAAAKEDACIATAFVIAE
jgi:hypothetical protein